MIDGELVGELRRSFAAALADEEPGEARAALVRAGWLDALEADSPAAVAVLFRLQGRLGRDAAALDDVITHALGVGDAAVAYRVAPAVEVILPAHRHAERLLRMGDDTRPGHVVELAGPLETAPVRGIDPAAGLLSLCDARGRTEEVGDSKAWARATADARIALSHHLVGATQVLLELATAYASDRRQFGTPIGAFQAVKHRLADVAVAVAAADAAALAASTASTETAASVAKILAGRAAAVAGANCLQVFGGIGFTTEHDFPRRFRRLLVLDRLLGDARTLERQLGAQLRTGDLTEGTVVDLDDQPRLEVV